MLKFDINNLFNEIINKNKSEVLDEKHSYIISIELPGIKKDGIRIEYKGYTLYVYTINSIKAFKSFVVPNVDILNSKAQLEDGILKIILPKTHQSDEIYNISIE